MSAENDWSFFGERLSNWWKAGCPHSEFEEYGLPQVQGRANVS
jgi:hypothetical protein